MSRYRFLILATLAAVVVVTVVTVPVLMNRPSVTPGLGVGSSEERSRAEFARRQADLETVFSSPEYLRRWRAGRLVQGDPVGRLIIPKLAVDLIVVEGVSGDSLRAGAGHYPDSALPPGQGNVAIAGHRTGFGRPFGHLDRLQHGDVLILITPDGRFTYELMRPFDGHTNPWVTQPLDWGVIGPLEDAVVTLTTTHPPHDDRNRLIARFALVKKPPAYHDASGLDHSEATEVGPEEPSVASKKPIGVHGGMGADEEV